MFALVAGVSLFVVLLLIWSALYQRGLLWRAEESRSPAAIRFEAGDTRDEETVFEAVPANSARN